MRKKERFVLGKRTFRSQKSKHFVLRIIDEYGKERFCMRTYITELCEGGHHSTAKSYQDALNSFKRFSGREEIPYTYINNENLLFYQNFGETLRRQIGETCGEPAGRGEGL